MKKRISKILAVVLALTMVMGLAACGSKTEEPAAEETAAAADTEEAVEEDGSYVIGFANASVTNTWRVKMRDMLMDAADELGVEIIETDANDDANTMISNIESMLQQGVDAILITPCTEDGVNAGIEEAYEAGIPVILFDRTCSTDQFTHFIGYSDKNNGAACAQLMVDALTEKYGEPKGKILALDSMAGSGTDNGQKEGQESVFKDYPDIEIVDRNYTDFEVSIGKSLMEDWLAKYGPGEIDGFISQDGGVTLGAMDAITEAGREGDKLIIVNADGINGIAKGVEAGTVYGYTQFPCCVSVDALKLAIQCIEGEDPYDEQVIELDSIIVTKENNKDYVIPDGDDYDWTL